jgi:hypothetical protein
MLARRRKLRWSSRSIDKVAAAKPQTRSQTFSWELPAGQPSVDFVTARTTTEKMVAFSKTIAI